MPSGLRLLSPSPYYGTYSEAQRYSHWRLMMHQTWQPGQLERFPLFDLPIAAYLVAEDGTLLEGNRRLREMLALPSRGGLSVSLVNFYKNIEHRADLLERAREASKHGHWLEKAMTVFVVGGEERRMQVYCGAVKSPEGEETFLGCLIDVTEEEALKELIDFLPAGLFQATSTGELVQANSAFAKLLGFDEPSQLYGKKFAELLADKDDFSKIHLELQKQAVARWERLELRRGRETFLSNFSATLLQPTASISGEASILGTLQDVSDRELLRELLETAPVGVYKVLYEGNRHIIVECNEAFGRMFDLDNPRTAKGLDIRALHQDVASYDHFLDELRRHEAEGRAMHNYRISTTLHNGRSVTFLVNARLLYDKKTHVEIGRIGILSDVTGSEQEDRATRLIRNDIGNFLHEYDKVLTALRIRFPSVRKSLELAYQKRSHSSGDLGSVLEQLIIRLLDGVEQDVLPLRDFPDVHDAFPAPLWEKLSNLVDSGRRVLQQPHLADFNISNCHGLANEIGSALEKMLQSQRFQRTRIKELLRTATQASAAGGILAVDKMVENVGSMIQGSRALRDSLTSGSRSSEASQLLGLSYLIEQALRQVSDYAEVRRVTFKNVSHSKNVKVKVVERDMVRALSNLFHNAIKYSWSHDVDTPAWVTIRAAQEGRNATIEIENYGVPLTVEEIKSGRIFELGFRGSLALDRGRAGTGIGLADAKTVITQARGKISLSSRPATSGAQPDDYTKPFLTTVRVELPAA